MVKDKEQPKSGTLAKSYTPIDLLPQIIEEASENNTSPPLKNLMYFDKEEFKLGCQ